MPSCPIESSRFIGCVISRRAQTSLDVLSIWRGRFVDSWIVTHYGLLF